jgi:Kef-type K+ transport system membrane component KefB
MIAQSRQAPSQERQASHWWTTVGYSVMLVASIGLFFLIQRLGQTLSAPPANAEVTLNRQNEQPTVDVLLHVLMVLGAVIITGRLLGRVFRYLRQPPVIGEVLGGIVLGPSLLGRLWPEASEFLLPPTVSPYLGVISTVGVILYMFMVGLELNVALLRRRAHATLATSHASITAPFLLGSTAALFLYPLLSNRGVSFTSFALFMGVAMSITAFPVLARILTDRGMQRTELGVLSLSCAAINDVTGWCLLAFVVGVSQAKVGGALVSLALTAAYVAFMFLVVGPIATRLVAPYEGRLCLPSRVVTLVFLALVLSALITQSIGIHALFGAFLLGAVIPHDSAVARQFVDKLEGSITVLLLPSFFAFTGMRTQIGLVSGWEQWLLCGSIVLIAIVGKFGGTLVAARLTGLNWRMAAALGVLMNTRGMVELIVLNIGLDLGIISPTLFAMLVIMAIVTTMTAAPALHLLMPHGPPKPRAEEKREAVELANAY